MKKKRFSLTVMISIFSVTTLLLVANQQMEPVFGFSIMPAQQAPTATPTIVPTVTPTPTSIPAVIQTKQPAQQAPITQPTVVQTTTNTPFSTGQSTGAQQSVSPTSAETFDVTLPDYAAGPADINPENETTETDSVIPTISTDTTQFPAKTSNFFQVINSFISSFLGSKK